jgi:hypothetical protein
MAVSRRQNFDLSTVIPGTPQIITLGKESDLNLVSVQINQSSVSATGIDLKLVQSNNATDWIEIQTDAGVNYSKNTRSTSEVVFLSAEYLRFAQAGLSIDVTLPTTGELEIIFNFKAWR